MCERAIEDGDMSARRRGRELDEWTERDKAERGGEQEREGEAAEAFI